MKIALLHDSVLPPKNYGGIERIVMTLAKEYTARGHEVLILSRQGTSVSNYECIQLPSPYKGEDISHLLPADVDFIHSHQPLREKPGKFPFLVTIHGNGHPEEHYWPNTNFLSQSHARNHNAKHFIYNGVDPGHYPFVENKDDYFVFLARTTWRVKNLKTALVWAKDLGLKLEIMGGSGVSRGDIHYNGLVDEEEKLKLLSRAKALIYPTNWDEPCAAAPLEALACGTPVISSINGCMPELVRPGTGILCENYDQLLQAAKDVETIRPKDCRESIESFFSLGRMSDDYLSMFEKILQDGELDHQPRYNFDPSSVKYLYKPSLKNRLQLSLTGKI